MGILRTVPLLLLGFLPLLAGSVAVENPYVREVPPGMKNSAAFMTLVNHGKEEAVLVKARSSASKVVELHTHTMEGGRMVMRQIPRITVPAEGTTELKPGGLHVMLIGLKKPIKTGDTVEVELYFSNGEELTVKAPVMKVAAGMMQMHGDDGHSSMEHH